MKTIPKQKKFILTCLLLLAYCIFLLPGRDVAARGGVDSYKSLENILQPLNVKQEAKERFPKFLEQEPDVLDDFKLPYLRLDSPDAQAFNTEIRELAEKAYLGFDMEYRPYLHASYECYLYEDYLSILLGYGIWTDIQIFFERAYCFHLPTGKLLSNEELLADLGYGDKSAEEIAEDTLFYYNRIHQAFDRDLNQMEKTMLGTSLDWLWSGDATPELYLDNVGRLMLNQMIAIPAGSGQGYAQIEALHPILAGDAALNSLYVDVAKELGDFDPYSDTAPMALIAYLGEQDPDNYLSVDDIFSRLAAFLASFDRYNVPSLHYNMKYEPETYESKVDGSGFFLIIPRLERQMTAIGFEGFENPVTTPLYFSLDTAALVVHELGSDIDEVTWECYLRDRYNLIGFSILADEEGYLYDLPVGFYDFTEYVQGLEDLYYRTGHFYDEYEPYLSFFWDYD